MRRGAGSLGGARATERDAGSVEAKNATLFETTCVHAQLRLSELDQTSNPITLTFAVPWICRLTLTYTAASTSPLPSGSRKTAWTPPGISVGGKSKETPLARSSS